MRGAMLLSERILYIDGDAIVIDKPAGLPVDPPRSGGPSVEGRAAELRMGFRTSPVAMHRIDTDTTGCLLLARNARARREYQAAFESRAVEKTYIAVVEGVVPDDVGVIDLPLAKFSTAAAGWRMVHDEAGKNARTHWRRIGTIEDKSLVEFRPETGRTHQIRVHAARGLGCAIVGDPMYSDREEDPEQPMLLHAWKLRVERGAKPAIDVTAPIPDAFGLFLDFLAEGESAA
jgi:tRNA pseudouridine32 synthase/23S rRNA pseudouridine746 synthase